MKSICPYSPREQLMFMLLVALRIQRKPKSKKEILEFIQEKNWFDLCAEDKIPYKSQGGEEPRWMTLIAWARKDCVDLGLMEFDQRDSWSATKNGLNLAAELPAYCHRGEYELWRCFLWKNSFKELLDPNHQTSERDLKRPSLFYRDSFPRFLRNRSGD